MTQRNSLLKDALTLLAAYALHPSWEWALADPQEIDELNIRQATFLAMARAVADLPSPPSFALIDGRDAPDVGCPAQAVIKGDGRSLSIAAASIIAKTFRDAIMVAAEAEFPGYGFARHKGYGTAAHQTALTSWG